jgi:hypothetical protein
VLDFYQPPGAESALATSGFELEVVVRKADRGALFGELRGRFRRGLLVASSVVILVAVLYARTGAADWRIFAVVMGLALLSRWSRYQRAIENLLPRARRTRWTFSPDRLLIRAGGSRVEVLRKDLDVLNEMAGGILMGGGATLLFIPERSYDEGQRQAIREWFRPGSPGDARGSHRLVIARRYWLRWFGRFALVFVVGCAALYAFGRC